MTPCHCERKLRNLTHGKADLPGEAVDQERLRRSDRPGDQIAHRHAAQPPGADRLRGAAQPLLHALVARRPCRARSSTRRTRAARSTRPRSPPSSAVAQRRRVEPAAVLVDRREDLPQLDPRQAGRELRQPLRRQIRLRPEPLVARGSRCRKRSRSRLVGPLHLDLHGLRRSDDARADVGEVLGDRART